MARTPKTVLRFCVSSGGGETSLVAWELHLGKLLPGPGKSETRKSERKLKREGGLRIILVPQMVSSDVAFKHHSAKSRHEHHMSTQKIIVQCVCL